MFNYQMTYFKVFLWGVFLSLFLHNGSYPAQIYFSEHIQHSTHTVELESW